MGLLTLGGVLLAVAVAFAWDHTRALRSIRLARLLDDPRYGDALEILWDRQESTGAFLDALEYLVAEGVDRKLASRNLTRILGFHSEAARLAVGHNQPIPAASDLPNPWDRKATPATSSAFIMPATSFGRANAIGTHSYPG
jgi:hypothetical protein